MNSIDKLSEIFSRFPGIGPRQAKRFVYFLLSRDQNFRDELSSALSSLQSGIMQCHECMRYFASPINGSPICSICVNLNRDKEIYMIVPRDVDLDAIEKSGSFKGFYFVLGGSLPILEKEPSKRIRINELLTRIKNRTGIKEIILATNATSEGENTADFLRDEILKITPDVSISVLGRGLSTGGEIEYADPETLRNALKNRSS